MTLSMLRGPWCAGEPQWLALLLHCLLMACLISVSQRCTSIARSGAGQQVSIEKCDGPVVM